MIAFIAKLIIISHSYLLSNSTMPDSTASLSLRIVSSLPRNSFRLCLIILYKLKVKLPMSSLWHYGEADTLIQSEISQLSEEFFEVFQSLCLVSPKLLKVSLQTF